MEVVVDGVVDQRRKLLQTLAQYRATHSTIPLPQNRAPIAPYPCSVLDTTQRAGRSLRGPMEDRQEIKGIHCEIKDKTPHLWHRLYCNCAVLSSISGGKSHSEGGEKGPVWLARGRRRPQARSTAPSAGTSGPRRGTSR
eukprot:2746837-Rhodomonas_salina.2